MGSAPYCDARVRPLLLGGCYGSCIVAPHPELMRPTSVCGTDVLEPGMTISYPIRHPGMTRHDPAGSSRGLLTTELAPTQLRGRQRDRGGYDWHNKALDA